MARLAQIAMARGTKPLTIHVAGGALICGEWAWKGEPLLTGSHPKLSVIFPVLP